MKHRLEAAFYGWLWLTRVINGYQGLSMVIGDKSVYLSSSSGGGVHYYGARVNSGSVG